ncbi:hypothetical protein [Nonomuraea indica]|uniref:hypothetical protein n=1 Tax=Nonomuraea indica TaxID=1581193 RepID=UPI0011832FB7|nr:hypothetical protein [Nonomuraea indica]
MEAALLLLLGGGLWAIVYLLSCAIHPYKICPACKKSGQSNSTTFKGAFGACRRCKGTGRRIRAGARLLGRDK